MNSRLTAAVFWVLMAAFFGWDWIHSAPVNLRAEPPVVALGSGVAPSGAMCASTF